MATRHHPVRNVRLFTRNKFWLAFITCLAVILTTSVSAHAKKRRKQRAEPVPVVSTQSKLLAGLPHAMDVLANGLKIYAVKYPSPGVIAYQIPVRVGSRNEVLEGRTGFAHFFEHLMFRGTKKRTGKEFGDLYTRLGVENNAWTWNDMTNYHGTASPRVFEQILEAEADRFMNLSFDEKLFRDEAGAVLGEYNKNIANPENVIEEKLAELAFEKHTYGHTTMGYKSDIVKYGERYGDVWPFFKRHYRPSNTAIVVVGDIDPKRTIQLVKKYFGPWRNPVLTAAALRAESVPPEPVQTEARISSETLDKPAQTRLAIAYKIPPFSSENSDFAVLNAIAEIAFSDISPFVQKYRYEQKWLDSVYAPVIEMIDPGIWTVNLRLSNTGKPHTETLITEVQKTLNALASAAPSSSILTEAKNRLMNERNVGWFSSPDALASRIAWYSTIDPPSLAGFSVLDRVMNSIKTLAPNQIQSFAQTHLVEAKRNIVILRGNE